jgi:hypothetical protein
MEGGRVGGGDVFCALLGACNAGSKFEAICQVDVKTESVRRIMVCALTNTIFC